MKKTTAFILVALLVLGGGVFKYHQQQKQNKVIELISGTESETQKLCVSEKAEKRVECLSEKLKSISKSQMDEKVFFLIKKGEKTKLETEVSETVIKIKRTKEMSFGGQCVSNFFLFEFDEKFVYLSKDNLTGMVLCVSKADKMLITAGELSEEKIRSDLSVILGK